MENGTIIRTRGLSRDYTGGSQTVHALRDLDLTITEGEFVAIMGPSGSGKSTCMHLLGCLDTPSAGHYELDGDDIGSLSKDGLAGVRQRKVGFVFQSFNLLAGANAQRNVEMPLLNGVADRVSRNERAAEALEAVGLADRANHLRAQLAGGQMQRVAIARALVLQPRFVVLDEPTSALDVSVQAQIVNLLRDIQNRHQLAYLFISHDLKVIRALANEIIILRAGKVIEQAKTEQVFTSPRTDYTKALIAAAFDLVTTDTEAEST